MFPYADSKKTTTFPILTILFILINVLVFFFELQAVNFDLFIVEYSFIPATFDIFVLATWPQMFTAAFMHASVTHILFNMLFLWVFGDNVEERLGLFGFILFYAGAIIAATLLQYSVDPTSYIPNLGASGAIAGLLGFYLVVFPKHTIKTLVIGGYGGIYTITLPAQIFLAYWGITQLFSGIGSLTSDNMGGVAWFAHLGGFLFGIIGGFLVKILSPKSYMVESENAY